MSQGQESQLAEPCPNCGHQTGRPTLGTMIETAWQPGIKKGWDRVELGDGVTGQLVPGKSDDYGPAVAVGHIPGALTDVFYPGAWQEAGKTWKVVTE